MSATGTAIQMERGRPRGAILMSAVLAATLGIGFFAGRATDAAPATAPQGVSVIAPEIGTPGIGYRPAEGFKPHVPKRAPTESETVEGAKLRLPERWHMN